MRAKTPDVNAPERWIPIKGYENYLISDIGNVRSLTYGKDKYLSLSVVGSKTGGYYYGVTLRKDGKPKKFKAHRLVGDHFIGNPNRYKILNHLDEDPFNNHYLNLEWSSHRENTTYSIKRSKSSQFTGVYRHSKGKGWVAHITVNGKFKYLGLFYDEQQAGKAYREALQYYGVENKYAA